MSSEFADLIERRTRDFTNRPWVFTAIHAWLRDTGTARTFLLAGGPGTGKTAIAARLAQASDGAATIDACPGLVTGVLAYAHFCQAGRDSTISPLSFVRGLSKALANRFPTFRSAIVQQASRYVVVNSTARDVTVGAGSAFVNTNVEINVAAGDARALFDQLVRQPLVELCKADPAIRITILVDSLDEALTFHATENIVQLLRLAADFPAPVRFIMTARAKETRVADLVGTPSLNLDTAPRNDIVAYATARLAAVAPLLRDSLAGRIADQSKGNFLYAEYVLNELVGGKVTAQTLIDDLPDGLDEVYRRYLEREVASTSVLWKRLYRPLLGMIAVALGDGFTRAALATITGLQGSEIDDALVVCKQYLAGGTRDDEPFRIYHHSFREFLLGKHSFGVYPEERHAAVARALLASSGADWSTCDDAYALRYVPVHLTAAARAATPSRDELIRLLVGVVTDAAYQARCAEELLDVPMLHAHAHRAIAAASWSDATAMLPTLFRAGVGISALRRHFLRGDGVIALATLGDAAKAEARLPLFDQLEHDWQSAATAILGWLSLDKNPAAAAIASERTAAEARGSEVLALLAQRFAAAVRGQGMFAFGQNHPASLYEALQLVRRFTGQAFDRELLSANQPHAPQQGREMIQGGEFFATMDGPLLVACAREEPDGTAVLDEYIDAHAGYNYVQYRNRSLWKLLHAVLRHHPDQQWVLERLQRILRAALESGGTEQTPMAPLFAAAIQAGARAPQPTPVVVAFKAQAMAEIRALGNRRGANDSWGIHRRRLTSLIELEVLVRADREAAGELLDTITALEDSQVLDGFAGFRTPAELRLAEALRVGKLGGVDERLTIALRGAHQIQDYHFCARISSRCMALTRWHSAVLDEVQLTATIERLAARPSDPEFAVEHVIGEPYLHRQHGDKAQLSLAPAMSANTLDALAEVFQRPAVELLGVNPGRALTTPIANGTPVRIADPGFVPLLAIHLAARALTDVADKRERVRLIRSLAPVAAADVAALDAVTCYLLVAAMPSPAIMAEIVAALASRSSP